MLPPIVEIFVIWHPRDIEGEEIAQKLLEHFRGTAFSGLIGGAVEVFVRSVSSSDNPAGSPRTLPCIETLPYGVPSPALTAAVLVVGVELTSSIEDRGPWYDYVEAVVAARNGSPNTVGIFPVCTADNVLDGTVLGRLVGPVLGIAINAFGTPDFKETLCRDLAQGIAQMGADHERVTVFVSHTQRLSISEEGTASSLVGLVREVISTTKLAEFLDARDLQPNEDWEPVLLTKASTGALLAVRTDLYSSRPWCQREVLTAKRAGMPVVILDALTTGEERGSFLMDHVPRSPGRQDAAGWRRLDVVRVLGRLVDECMKRVLWRKQQEIAEAAGLPVNVDWWAHHAPEPATFADWLERQGDLAALSNKPIVVLHPDPPLGSDEQDVLLQMARLAKLHDKIEFLTPRGLAARGG